MCVPAPPLSRLSGRGPPRQKKDRKSRDKARQWRAKQGCTCMPIAYPSSPPAAVVAVSEHIQKFLNFPHGWGL
ncbi:unnamed protein product [Chondrus crispus]|uniref:Uncharacterized protein n=1 Tax=Chondrus crispus TaxID=2769 RepID=R7QKA1_CHOCR|nr:unnamed protein product [Chondrus crispus]CDF38952.1 unnamed protein product [Chondrus crispus]|eukprot:XP_005718857.1 unnamed protein product [Chondrus crispus]